ncbi:hypothetical protein H5410_030631 [Solanum commersonii]|uniref:Integrase core domain containing protein n=1 Tax=Solanum commersonii TaxID=4109 RepID=A0A9J5YGR1_SOLCO|nr:hypothetical protein H5410_030631 [Solanum commersonii]
MARLITEERRVLTGSLHTVPDIHRLFNLHKCDWMARDPGTYSEEIVREFYASYAATLQGYISKRSKPLAQDPLTSTLVRGDSGVSIWHCDRLIHPTGALDIGLIRDKANVAAPRREPPVEVPTLLAQWGKHRAMTSAPSIIPTLSRAPSLKQLAWALAFPGPHRSWALLLSPWPEYRS